MDNPLQLRGIEFVEFAAKDADYIHDIFLAFGFSLLKKFRDKEIFYYKQNDIHFLLNREQQGAAMAFAKRHGPSICSMGWRVKDAERALKIAVQRGAKAVNDWEKDLPYPAIYGIGDSYIYFIDCYQTNNTIYNSDFIDIDDAIINPDKGFLRIDHLTNNVYKGTMTHWANFYKDIFGFSEVRYFDIRGAKTGLLSYALRSPDGSFCIPINEGKDDNNNQIDEYLHQYHGPGVQHLAFLTDNLLQSLAAIDSRQIETLDINDDYYDTVYQRVPVTIKENKEAIKRHQVLVDGDEHGYLLQIFTKNLFGPIFIELIQRESHLGFGEGNFQALFLSIERDQQRRGVI